MKKIITTIAIFLTLTIQSQIKPQIEIYQDFKLLTYENSHQLKAPTADILVKLLFVEKGDFGMGLSFEYADLYQSSFKRLAIDIHHFEFKISNKIKAGMSLNAGITNRFNIYALSYGADANLMYKLTDRYSIGVLTQVLTRPHIDKVVFSNFFGIKYNLKK